jgi:hypothetical protein
LDEILDQSLVQRVEIDLLAAWDDDAAHIGVNLTTTQ